MEKTYYNKEDGQTVPVKMWLNDYEQGGLDQAINVSKLPFVFKHVALMPDMHQGYGVPIGSVFATKDIIIPNAVGVDIGCGMATLKLPITDISLEQIKEVFGGSQKNKGGIRSKVPVGRGHHPKKQDEFYMPDWYIDFDNEDELPIVKREYFSALKQVGTLGGGNHFIEVQKGSDGYIYLMIHSGSRNLGYQVAKHYNQVAKDMCKMWCVTGDILKADLAYLPTSSKEGEQYIEEMQYCVLFAKNNRKLMMERCVSSFVTAGILSNYFDEFSEDGFYDVAHNYASLEHHFGKNVWVHRKGATRAYDGEIGIIPGSQGSKSYIIKGKGNVNSFMSCSHGAGRTMSRKKAIENLNLEEETKILADSGNLLHTVRGKSSLDESPSAYKDIEKVMKLQEDLIDIVVELSPLACIKG